MHKAGGYLKVKTKRNVLRTWGFGVFMEVYRWECLVLGYKWGRLGRKGIYEHMFRKSGIIEAKRNAKCRVQSAK